MNDLISRQAAIDALIKWYGCKPTDIGAFEDIIEELSSAQPEPSQVARDIANIIENEKDMRVIATQRWILCSDRLPDDEEKDYWVCTNTGYQCQCRWTNNKYGIGISQKWGWKLVDIPQYAHVIAWQPLPEPYKADMNNL